jgi:hypothetical protein
MSFKASLLTVACLVGVASLGQGTARAEDPQRARELFQEGTTYFDVGQFDKAIESWQRGYKEKPDPGFLYNIAQAYRLQGDPHKAIFFYRGFLRNSPRAPNREDVEQKIATLQKLIGDQERVKTAPPTGPSKQDPPASAPPPAPPPGSTTPPPPTQDGSSMPPTVPDASNGAATGATGATESGVVSARPPEPKPADDDNADLGVAIGVDGWGKSVQGKAEASFAFALSGGYTFAGPPDRRFEFRLGALMAFTFLAEGTTATWKETFWSFMVEPLLRYRMSPGRFSVTAALGVGGIALGGLRPGSALLVKQPGTTIEVSGTQGLFVLRPALGAELTLTHGLLAVASLAFPYSPKPQKYYYAPIARTEFLLGLSYRF